MRTDILLVSYLKDLPWAEYCLRSIKKFSSGFGGVTLMVPRKDRAQFVSMVGRLKMNDFVSIKDYVVKPGHEFNHHQVMKCYADVLCPNAAYILHVDSDCIFTEPFSPSDYMDDEGRPYLPVRRYYESAPFYCWKKATETALGVSCPYETMARHPALHHESTYRRLRSRVELNHGVPFSEYVLGLGGNYPDLGFSEFNALGSFVIYADDGDYDVIHIDEGKVVPPNKLIQGHSWGGVEAFRKQFDSILR